MRCMNIGCTGEYDRREIPHVMRGRGKPLAASGMPAGVCSVCGDTLLDRDTLRRLQQLRQVPPARIGAIPMRAFADVTVEEQTPEPRAAHSAR